MDRSVDLEDFFENAAIPLHIVGPSGEILRANQAELRLLGYTCEEYIGRNIADFHTDADVIADILSRLGAGEKLESYPARLKAKDGSVKHVLITSSAQFAEGQFIQTRCFSLDVTDKRRAERHFQQTLDAMPAAVYTTDVQGRITYYNQAAMDLAGRRPEIGVDQWCVSFKLFREDGTPLPHDQCPMAIALKENRPVRDVQAWAERPDGTRVPFVPYPTPLYDENGKLVGAVNMMVDVSTHKRAEKVQALLIDELNHRVKNTLAVVQSLAHQTLRSTNSPASFVSSFTGRLEALSRAHTVLSESTWKGSDLGVLIKKEVLLGEPEDARVVFSGPQVHLTPQQALNLALVFHELSVNARKYGALSTPKGQLKVDWTLADDGAQRILLNWIEAGPQLRRKADTLGFGSTLIHQVVAQDGGKAQMTVRANGIEWHLEIARLQDESLETLQQPLSDSLPSRPSEPGTGSIRGKRILIVEDEILIAWELRRTIEEAGGIVVGLATSIAEARAAIVQTFADVAFLDSNLRGSRSDELASLLVERNIPFAFVTGYDPKSLHPAFRDIAVIPKPFTPEDIVNTVARLSPNAQVVTLRA